MPSFQTQESLHTASQNHAPASAEALIAWWLSVRGRAASAEVLIAWWLSVRGRRRRASLPSFQTQESLHTASQLYCLHFLLVKIVMFQVLALPIVSKPRCQHLQALKDAVLSAFSPCKVGDVSGSGSSNCVKT